MTKPGLGALLAIPLFIIYCVWASNHEDSVRRSATASWPQVIATVIGPPTMLSGGDCASTLSYVWEGQPRTTTIDWYWTSKCLSDRTRVEINVNRSTGIMPQSGDPAHPNADPWVFLGAVVLILGAMFGWLALWGVLAGVSALGRVKVGRRHLRAAALQAAIEDHNEEYQRLYNEALADLQGRTEQDD